MPAAPSPAQSAASRHNGAHSHAPVTDAGKAASSANAISHGICSARLELDDAAAERLAWHVAAMLRDWLPGDEFEKRLVHELAVVALKLARLDTPEVKALDAAIAGSDARFPTLGSLARYRRALRLDQQDIERRLINIQKAHAEVDTAAQAQAAAAARMNGPVGRRDQGGEPAGLGRTVAALPQQAPATPFNDG